MRFCPFCSAENAEEATHCSACARRLPPLPPRRRKPNRSVPADAPEPRAGGAAPAHALAERPERISGLHGLPLESRRQRTPPPPEYRSAHPASRRHTDLGSDGGLHLPTPPPPAAPEPRAAIPEPRPTTELEGDDDWSMPGPGDPAPDPDDWSAIKTRTLSEPPDPRAEVGTPPRVLTPDPVRSPSPAVLAAHAVTPRPDSTGSGDDFGDGPTVIADPPSGALRRPDPSAPSASPAVRPASAPLGAELAHGKRRGSSPPPTPTDAPRRRQPTLPEPPPTRVNVLEPARDRNFQPPEVAPVPEVPEPGFFNALRYAMSFTRARWQRRSAIKALQDEIKEDTASLDNVLGTLGKQARALAINNRVLSSENAAIDEAEAKKRRTEQSLAELSNRQAEENSKFAEVEAERQAKVSEGEAELEEAQNELAGLEAQRRGLRDKLKTIVRQQKGYLKSAEERDEQAGKAPMGEERAGLRRAAEDLRRDAAALDPDRQDLERRLAALEKPVSKAMASVETLKGELESARRSLNDAREGHRHRLAEVEAEQGRKSRELAQADAEIQRRLVTLGTLVNLHRIESPEFDELYGSIDKLRGAIGSRSTEIDRLTAEREAYDRGSLIRGYVVIGAAGVVAITLVVILLAIF